MEHCFLTGCPTPEECQASRNCLGGLSSAERVEKLASIRGALREMPFSEKLRVLESQCQHCRDCPHGETAKHTFLGKGDPLSALAFVGEAPGKTDEAKGELFVGESGQLLDKMIARMQQECKRSRIEFRNPYICNVVKHHPAGGKLLKSGVDVQQCKPKLFAQLNALPNLKVVVALGRVASQALLGVDIQIGILRGHSYHNTRTGFDLRWMQDTNGADLLNSSSEWRDPTKRLVVVPTWHPAYLLHQPNRMEPRHQCWADLQLALKCLQIGLDNEIPF